MIASNAVNFYTCIFLFDVRFFLFFHFQTMPSWPSFLSNNNRINVNLVSATAIVLVLLVPNSIDCHQAPCLDHFWLTTVGSCEPCTNCDEQSIVLRPCQPHKDTICGTINDLEFEWGWVQEPTEQSIETNWKEVITFI